MSGTDDQRHILVAGASGVIGSAVVEHFARMGGWRVTALSRRRPVVAPDAGFTHLGVDLVDAAACAAAIAGLPPVTHFVHAAVSEAPGLASGWRDPDRIALNGAMFTNLLDPLARAGHLRHVQILQGAKAYGAHVHPVTVPCREDAPRDPHPNFYWLHEDALRASATRHGFAFTIWRPQVLVGTAPGAAMNPAAAIGAYAAICAERGLPCPLPGDSEALWELVDAGLLAEAMDWATDAPQAAGEVFNLTNGDLFVLRHAWAELAAGLGLDPAGTPPESFTAFFADPESHAAWDRLAVRHGLAVPSLDAMLGESHHYLDLLLSSRIAAKTAPTLLSTIKLRQAGFSGCRDSLLSLRHQLARMAELRVLPPIG